MIIQSKPFPKLMHFFRKSNTKTGLFFYKLGRAALLDCLIRFGLKKGDAIIVPSYICYSTIEPLESYGFKIIFVEIKDNLLYDLDVLQTTMEKESIVKAILLVYFFGLNLDYSQVFDLTNKYKVRVINDLSHSCFMKSKLLSSEHNADATIYSFRKSLPVSDGGALNISNNDTSTLEIKSCISKISALIYLIFRSLEKIICMININIYSQFISNIRSLDSQGKKTNLDHLAQCKPSNLLVNILSDNDYMTLSEERIRHNYKCLADQVEKQNFKIFLKDLSLDSVPQALILEDKTGLLCDHLRKNGVGAWKWPDNEIPEKVSSNTKKFPTTNRLNYELVLVPIHQDLGSKHISYIVEKFSNKDFK